MGTALREVLARLAIDVDDAQLKKAEAHIDAWKTKVQEAGKAFSASSINKWAMDTVSAMQGVSAELRKVAAMTGLSTREVQELGFAGAAPEVLAASLRHLSTAMVEANAGSKEAKATFAKLGVEIKGADGKLRPTIDVLEDMSRGIQGLPTEVDQVAAAMKVFGKNGTEMMPFLLKSPEELAKLKARFAELGGGLSDNAIAKLAKLGRAQKELKLATTSLQGALAGALAPSMAVVATKIADAAAWFGRVSERSNILQVALIALGIIAVGVAVSMYGAYLPWIALIVVAALLIDDLYTTITGGPHADTIVNRMADGLGKLIVGTTDTNSAWFQFLDTLIGTQRLGPVISGFFSSIGSTISKWASSAYGAASEFVSGLVQGIVDGASAAAAAVGRLAERMTKAMKDPLGIHSPSTLTYGIGLNLDQGLIEGLTAGARGVDSAARDVLDPSAYAPSSTAYSSTRTDARQQSVTMQNDVTIQVTSSGGGSISEDIRRGVGMGLADDRDALLAALEPVAG